MNRNQLWENYLNNKLTDVEIIVNDGYSDNVFKCHKVVLAASEGYFGALFNSGMRECHEDRIKLQIITPQEVFQRVLHFLYTGIPDKANNVSILLDILKCATFFQLPGLEKSVESDIKMLGPADIVELIRSLINSRLMYFPHILIDTMVKNFHGLEELPEILEIPFQAMYSLLSDPNLQVEDEEHLLHFVLKYLSAHSNFTLPKKRALGKTIIWEHIRPTLLQDIGAESISQLIDEPNLLPKIREFEDRVSIFPDNYLISLLLTENDYQQMMKFIHRYLVMRKIYLSIKISEETCKRAHLVLSNWKEDGRFECHMFSFRISFEEGYVGSFFNISFKLRRIVGCNYVHIAFKPNFGCEESIRIPLNQDLNIIKINQEIISGSLLEYIRVSVTGGNKPHGHIMEPSIEFCIHKLES